HAFARCYIELHRIRANWKHKERRVVGDDRWGQESSLRILSWRRSKGRNRRTVPAFGRTLSYCFGTPTIRLQERHSRGPHRPCYAARRGASLKSRHRRPRRLHRLPTTLTERSFTLRALLRDLSCWNRRAAVF